MPHGLKGRISTLREAADATKAFYAAKPLLDLPYNWTSQREMTDQTCLEIGVFSNALVLDVFNVYLPSIGCFISNMSYGGSLRTFGVEHDIADGELHVKKHRNIIKIPGISLLIGGHANHYHWMLNWLPRYHAFCELNPKRRLLKPDQFVVNYDLPAAHRESLTEIGIEDNKILKINSSDCHYLFEELIIPNFFSSHYYYADVLNFLRTYIDYSIPRDESPIFVSRNALGRPRRRIVNESEVLASLADFGVRRIILEEMSFRDQVRAFSQTWCMIGAHGAGMANLAFGRKGSDCLLFERNEISEFEELAMLSGVRCQKITCDQYIDLEYEAKNTHFETRNRDIIVDIPLVKSKLARIMRKRS